MASFRHGCRAGHYEVRGTTLKSRDAIVVSANAKPQMSRGTRRTSKYVGTAHPRTALVVDNDEVMFSQAVEPIPRAAAAAA